MDAEPASHEPDIPALPPPVSMVPGVHGSTDERDAHTPPHIDGYEVLGYLGEGASGIVWRAIQLSTGRQVALKLMGGAIFGTEKARARFEREVELAARLSHANVARLYESGIRQGYYYYAMELIEGIPLDQFAQEHKLSQCQIIILMQKVCIAVQHAHAAGVIHRDLKPSNILVSSDGEPHILDFGLAKAIDRKWADVTVTIDGEAAGTVAYMSPEQAAGKLNDIGVASDVYSLGVILFQLLTGQFPHEQSGPILAQLNLVVQDEPRRPRSINKKIDRDLEAIILHALAREPKNRYTIAAELAKDLGNYLAGNAVQARPLTLPYFLGKRLRKHRARVAIFAAVLLLFVATLITAYVRIARERNYANQQADAANQALYYNRIALAAAELEKHHVARVQELLNQCPPSLRAWEWHYLMASSDQSIRTFQTGPGRIRYMAVNQAGNLIYSKDGKQLDVMRLDNGKIIASRQLATSRIAFSPDGSSAAVSQGTKVWIVDTNSLHDRTTPTDVIGAIGDMAVNEQGEIAVRCDPDEVVLINNTGDIVDTWRDRAFTGRLYWRQDDRLVVLNDNGYCVMNCNNGSVEERKSLAYWQRTFTFCATAFALLGNCPDGKLRKIDIDSGEVRWAIPPSETDISIMVMSQSGDRLFTGSPDSAINVWDASSGKHIRKLLGHTASISGICVEPQSQRIISADYEGAIKVWPGAAENTLFRQIDFGQAISSTAVCASRGEYLVGLESGDVLVMDASGNTIDTLFTGIAHPSCLAIDEAGRRLFVGSLSGGGSLWNWRAKKVEYHLASVAGGNFFKAKFSPDGQWLGLSIPGTKNRVAIMEASSHRIVCVFDCEAPFIWQNNSSALLGFTADGKLQKLDIQHQRSDVQSLQLPDQKAPMFVNDLGNDELIAVSETGQVFRLDTHRGQTIPLASFFGGIGSIGVSPDKRRLFIGTENVIRIINPLTGATAYQLITNELGIPTYIDLPDARHLVASGLSSIRIWYDAETPNTKVGNLVIINSGRNP